MKTLVISPHPDDEVLGAGGTLFKRKQNTKNSLYWIIMTGMSEADFSLKQIKTRKNEIKKIEKIFNFKKVFNLNYKSGKLDTIPKKELVEKISSIIKKIKPQEIFIPSFSDVHSDHKVTFEKISTCTKNFRFNFIKRILAYEVLSETNFNLNRRNKFFPNYYEDITNFINKKKNAVKIYKSEIKKFPFPRSIKAIDALAKVRGSEISTKAAEAFELLKKINY